jgi:hypothetical protein
MILMDPEPISKQSCQFAEVDLSWDKGSLGPERPGSRFSLGEGS